ncbi:MAG: hypothetical protein LBG92_10855 [Prevotellaceae bacterium]|nr:hypothetical protein [Prevotellaceae bacterium]
MKKSIILSLFILSFGALSAQQPDKDAKRELELEIKRSGNYLFYKAICKTRDEAVKMAKNGLISEINKEVLNHPDLIDLIDLIDSELEQGKLFRVIAYLKKDNIQAVLDNQTPPAVKIEDRKEKKEETSAVAKPQKKQQETVVQEIPAPVQPEVEETEVSKPEKPQPAPDSMKNTGDLLGQILKASSMLEVQKLLKENKMKGKVAYGTMDKLAAPEKAYLIVYKKTGEIVAILDKGSVVSRKDLLSGEIKANTIIEQNQVIWFQLF